MEKTSDSVVIPHASMPPNPEIPVTETRPAAPLVRTWWLLLFSAAILRMVMMPYGGHTLDINVFKTWAATLAEVGASGFYSARGSDYLPGYLYFLWGIGELQAHFRLNDQALLFLLKLPAAVADLLTGVLIRRMAERFTSERPSVLAAALYLFNPALIFVSAYWGQVDSVGAFLAMGALSLFIADHPLAWGIAITALLVKPQTAPIIAVLAFALLRRSLVPVDRTKSLRAGVHTIMTAVLVAAATLIALIAPFKMNAMGAVRHMRVATNLYPHGSVNAFNLWGAVQGFWQSDAQRFAGLPAFLWGLIAILAVAAIVLVTVWQRPQDKTVVTAGAVILVATFLLPTRIHERYLATALPFLALASAIDRRYWPVYGGLTFVLLLNLVYAYARPEVQTFALPAWLDATVFSPAGVRVLSVAATLSLPYLLWTLRHRNEVHGDPTQHAIKS